jgi:1-deoxy-D-xylulose-5-phosphate reductoisomerase
LLPTISALKAGKRVALANKEVLVMAGEIISQAIQYEQQIIPIDSEHSAIWQCLEGEENKVRRIFLTASGGPFYNYSANQLAEVSATEALKHPVWKMGKKVTVDSATLMNKGLEIIEAHWLFSIPLNRIEILIHPQSIVHSMVEFVDNSLKAQLSFPDMRIPIQYALSYPERMANTDLPVLDLCQIGPLTFTPADYTRFPCLQLARDAGGKGGTYPAVLCAADEVAVELFLKNEIEFTKIPRLIGETLDSHRSIIHPSLEMIMEADTWARQRALQIARKGST